MSSSTSLMIVKHYDIRSDFHSQLNGFSFSGTKRLGEKEPHAGNTHPEPLRNLAK